MPLPARLIKNAATYGVKYGPAVYEAVKHGRGPAQAAAQRAIEARTSRRRALEHARTVREGSVLKAVRDGHPVWVVFSADEPIAAYPMTTEPLTELVRHNDLSKRETPDERPSGSPASRLRRRRAID